MLKVIKILKISLFLLFLLLIIHCSKNIPYDCESKKIEKLFNDIFQKRANYPTIKNVQSIYDSTLDDSAFSYKNIDSSKYFIYLYSANFKIPKKEYYLHMTKISDITYPDSVKLKEIQEPSMQNKYTQMIEIELIEVNKDTTKLTIKCGYSKGVILLTEAIYTYAYNEKICSWNVLDSTIWRY